MTYEHRTSEDGGYTALVRGAEVHVIFHRAGVITRRSVRAFFGPLLEEHGMVTTRCGAGDERLQRFLTRLNFQHSWSDANYDYYVMTALPFSKEMKCQQQ